MKDFNETEFFSDLKKIRIEKNLTLDQISRNTRIQAGYLESLESGDLLAIPEVYDKLFFKSYLRSIGVAEEEKYQQFLLIRESVRKLKTPEPVIVEKEKTVKKINYKNILVFLPIAVVVVIIIFLVKNTSIPDQKEDLSITEIDVQEVADKIEARIDSVKLVEQEKTIADSIDGLNLVLSGAKQTWFRIIIDKSDTSEYMLRPGEKVEFKANKNIRMLVGRADGLKLNFNGKDLDSLGTSQQVVRFLEIDSSGVIAKTLVTPQIQQAENAQTPE